MDIKGTWIKDFMENKGQNNGNKPVPIKEGNDNFVLEKSIFSNIFEKDIRRVYIYKKAERLARAVHLIAPAFAGTPAFRTRADAIAMALVDAATLPPREARDALSRELLALSSLLTIAHTGSLLSPMNANLIAREAHLLLEEVASYDEPRLSLPDAPSLAELSRSAERPNPVRRAAPAPRARVSTAPKNPGQDKRQIKDTGRRESIAAVLKEKGSSYIKDISTVIRNVSEKTIQRELQAMVADGILTKEGERRWTRYSLA